MKCSTIVALTLFAADVAEAAETFVTITQVSGQKIIVTETARGRGARRGRGGRGGFGRGGRGARSTEKAVIVPTTAKITAASRERRTGKFRVGVELSGGFRNKVFRELGNGIQARIVTEGRRITQINVFTNQPDINQALVDPEDGTKIIAVRPKRPPQKK